jgi:spermidine synthase
MRAILILFFFFSGVSALIYQIVWMRMLTLVFGVTSFAVATVLSAFMAGLALGSYYGGRYVDKWKRPLLVFSGLQLGIGAFALVFPILLGLLTTIYVFLYREWPASLYVFSLLRFVLSFGLLLIPTTLMGATLPVIVKHFVKNRSKLGSNVGILYSANNWGAVLGGLAAGFVMIEMLGVRETAYIAAAISIAIGICTLFVERRVSMPVTEIKLPEEGIVKEDVGEAYSKRVLRVVLWVFAIEGFTSLAYEVIWTRILAGSLIVSTTYAYTLVVATFIAGLAIGSLIIGRFADSRKDLLSWLAGIEIAIGLSAIALLPLFHSSDMFVKLLGEPGNWGAWVWAVTLWLGILMLVPTTLMGATFPLVSKIYTVNFRELGKCIGKVGCLDTVGSIFGAFAGGFILIPLLGMQKSILILAFVNVLLGIWVIVSHPKMARIKKSLVTALPVVAVVAAYSILPHEVIFQPWWWGKGDIATNEGWHIVDYNEGIGSTITVSRTYKDDAKVLFVDGADVAGTGRPLETTQITQAHLPLLIFEAQNGIKPERALTIGLGSGGTSYCLSRHDLKDIHCCELLQGVLDAAKKHFPEMNHDVFSDPRYRVFIQDARAFVLAVDEKYDVIMDDSVHPGFQGNASLYSRDFFEHCRDRLTEGGVMSVWMPVFLISEEDLKMIFRGFCDVFPHATLWRATNDLNIHMVLIGTQEPLELDFEKFRQRVEVPSIRNDLARVDLEDPYTLLNCLLLDEKSLQEYCKDSPPHRDDYPLLSFSCARSYRKYWNNDPWMERVSSMADYGCSVLPYVTNLGKTEEEVAHNEKQIMIGHEVSRHMTKGYLAMSVGNQEDAIREGTAALKLNPLDKNAKLLVNTSRHINAYKDWMQGRTARAERGFRDIISSDPDFFYAHEGLSFCHWKSGDVDKAIKRLEYAMGRNPGHDSRRYWLAGFYAQRGLLDKAEEQLYKVLEAFPGEPDAIRKLQELEEFKRAGRENLLISQNN